ncbi:MAG: NADH-quinone oxidoreductase subunit NuoG [Rickettsiales bacterium]|nr:NADH-quinone oxidoreductase subunit NuoG [Rickettsiales bacterium]
MPKLTVNGKEVEVPNGATVLQACEKAGEEIPHFCYHERLEIAGNCRMCLVQIEGGPPKPAASCAMPAGDNMVVHTNTPMVKKAREGVMEFLLANHPLDCPICDQGGECDLQDQAMAYGSGQSRFAEHKRSVDEKYMGPLIKTHMTRCIHCTRCVRFITDIAGVEELGAVQRGEETEITTYVEKSLTSELSGNIIDLCPVGALTSRPYAFKGRSWELTKTETVDVMDAVGSAIRVDSRGNQVMRVLPRINEDINEEWISDKTRFACDGLKLQRLDRPYVKKDGKLQPVDWNEALTVVAKKIKATSPEKIAAIAGDLVDAESMFALKELMENLDVMNLECRQDGAQIDIENRSSYLFNTGIKRIEEADVCLIIGSNPRDEAPIINARIRKTYFRNNLKIAVLGEQQDLTYNYDYLGNDPQILEDILSGTQPFSKVLKVAKKPMLIIGTGVMNRDDSNAIIGCISEIAGAYPFYQDDWNGYNVLHTAASRVAGLDMHFVASDNGVSKGVNTIMDAASKGEIDVMYLLGADEIDMSKLGRSFVIYQGHHGDAGAHRADVILPGCAYTEKDGTYTNTEGRIQQAKRVVFAPGEAKEDWRIIRALSDKLEKSLPFSDIGTLRAHLMDKYPVFGKEGYKDVSWHKFGIKGEISNHAFENPIKNFYMTDPISRASKTMAACVSEVVKGIKPESKKEEVA